VFYFRFMFPKSPSAKRPRRLNFSYSAAFPLSPSTLNPLVRQLLTYHQLVFPLYHHQMHSFWTSLALLTAAASVCCCQGYLSTPPDMKVQHRRHHRRSPSTLPDLGAIARFGGGWAHGGNMARARHAPAGGRLKMAESGAPPAKRKGKGPYKVIANNK